MLRRLVLISFALFSFFPAIAPAEERESTAAANAATAPNPDRLIIQVNGIVCSFCAHGLEKALSKLDGLDGAEHGNGVLVDIESQKVTLAFRPEALYPFAEIHRRIKKAGYDPVRFDFRVAGVLEEVNASNEVILASSGQRFRRAFQGESRSEVGQSVDWLVSLGAEQTTEDVVDQPIQVDSYVEN